MKIISLNVRGLGKLEKEKFNWVKSLIRFHNPDIFAIQESKRKRVTDFMIELLWGNKDFEYIFKPSVGQSGGLILIWDPSRFCVSGAVEKDFFLGIRGRWVGKTGVSVILNVYGPHNDHLKHNFWESLENIMQVDIDDWVICGDFNEVRRRSERQNCEFIESRAKMFNDFINKANLIEIPLGGRKFTRISDDGLKYSKLDRFLVSETCYASWEGISACTLDRDCSDHCPIVLKDSDNDFGPKPTRVFNNWFEDGKSIDLIKDAWNVTIRTPRVDCIFRDKLKNVKTVLKEKCNPKYNALNAEIDLLHKEISDWENIIGTRDLTDAEITSWLDSKKKWFQKDKEKADILKQKARIK
ncbi:uncharacterized protein [Rutidosis leptorrhynchoides]|uniref:uncharacterized protein n=1 Tax=Rutidosis leptorrhynchoides TaxID=125765 RepID=UPI003A997936